jgi:hypothetical protein
MRRCEAKMVFFMREKEENAQKKTKNDQKSALLGH